MNVPQDHTIVVLNAVIIYQEAFSVLGQHHVAPDILSMEIASYVKVGIFCWISYLKDLHSTKMFKRDNVKEYLFFYILFSCKKPLKISEDLYPCQNPTTHPTPP